MELVDIVMRLNGPIDPVGDSGIDAQRNNNLRDLCRFAGLLLERIENVAEATDDHLASVKAAKDVAAAFLADVRGVRVLPEPQRVVCGHCLGAGIPEGSATQICRHCDGSGFVAAGVLGDAPSYSDEFSSCGAEPLAAGVQGTVKEQQ